MYKIIWVFWHRFQILPLFVKVEDTFFVNHSHQNPTILYPISAFFFFFYGFPEYQFWGFRSPRVPVLGLNTHARLRLRLASPLRHVRGPSRPKRCPFEAAVSEHCVPPSVPGYKPVRQASTRPLLTRAPCGSCRQKQMAMFARLISVTSAGLGRTFLRSRPRWPDSCCNIGLYL